MSETFLVLLTFYAYACTLVNESLPYCRNMIFMFSINFYRYHPDKNVSNPEASELFKEVAYSYSILSDPEKRRQYDTAGFEVMFSSR